MTASPNQATLTPNGLAIAPIDAPAAVQEMIAAGNQIARLPYRYGGGHLTYEDTAYDCSGSISYVFAAAHLLDRTVVSGQLRTGATRARQVDHGVRQRRPHVHVRRRAAVRHGRAGRDGLRWSTGPPTSRTSARSRSGTRRGSRRLVGPRP